MNIDYEKIGFKCGLEIHVQLNTERKLFCSCPNKRSSEFSVKMERRIRPSAGELGKMDAAALQEFLRGRKFYYAVNPETSCLVETDEEPPHETNREALEIALSAAKALNCAVPDEICVMRKTVADGSAVSGFQRTALVGLSGRIETGSGTVGISNLSLEEDSAAPAGKPAAEFRLDRLGVPLIEIGTEPDIKNPMQAKQLAEQVGMMLLGNRLRGIGAIRQDLNVSINGGARVEIKGVQELGAIEAAIENEIRRQQSLIEIRNALIKRKASAGGMKDVTELFSHTKSDFIKKALKDGGRVFSAVLIGFAGLMKKDCGGKTFGKEMSSYAGVFGLGIIHSDEMEKFSFLADDFAALRKEFEAEENDMIFIVAGRGAEIACEAVLKRAAQAIEGVPEETRAANADGTTTYMRPLPGAARMYPETDVPPIKITRELLKKIKLPKSAAEKLCELEKILPRQMAEQMLRSEYLGLFERIKEELLNVRNRTSTAEFLEKKYNTESYLKFIAKTFTETLISLKREGVPVENISDKILYDIFVRRLALTREFFPDVLRVIAENPEKYDEWWKISQIPEVKDKRSFGMTIPIAEKIVKEIIEKNTDALAKPSAFSIIMGEAMRKLRGQVDGAVVAGIVKKEIDKRSKK